MICKNSCSEAVNHRDDHFHCRLGVFVNLLRHTVTGMWCRKVDTGGCHGWWNFTIWHCEIEMEARWRGDDGRLPHWQDWVRGWLAGEVYRHIAGSCEVKKMENINNYVSISMRITCQAAVKQLTWKCEWRKEEVMMKYRCAGWERGKANSCHTGRAVIYALSCPYLLLSCLHTRRQEQACRASRWRYSPMSLMCHMCLEVGKYSFIYR